MRKKRRKRRKGRKKKIGFLGIATYACIIPVKLVLDLAKSEPWIQNKR